MKRLNRIRFIKISILLLLVSISVISETYAHKSLYKNDSIEVTLQFFPANNSFIRYTGRIDFTDSLKPKFWMPGVYIEAKFVGSTCELLVNDEVKWGTSLNYLEIVVDDTIQKRVQTTGKENTILVADNLSAGEHTLLICKDTETNIGYLEFIGLRCKGLAALPAAPVRKIEFIGNSITCGTGIDQSVVTCGKGKWHDQHNAYMAYGPQVARDLKAQWQLTSYSGIGLIHSCCGITFAMPEVFDRINLTPGEAAWDFRNYVPDVVTICLGQNDGIQDSLLFCSTYVSFIKNIRKNYPNAQIVCLTSPMGNAELTAALKNYLTGIVNVFAVLGDNRVSKFFFSQSYNNGCDTHPDMGEHKLIATELEGYVKNLMGW